MLMRKLIMLMVAGFFGMAMFGGRGIVFASDGNDRGAATGQAATAETANKLCPVTGEEVDPKGTVTYTYKGKVYHFCCASCIADFKKNPEKYIRKMKDDAAKAKGPDHRHE
jgi:YHS domain-containing protein